MMAREVFHVGSSEVLAGTGASWTKSGLSQAEFCRRRGVKAVTLGWWRRRLAESTDDHESADGRRVRRRRRKPASRGTGADATFVEVALPIATERVAVTRSCESASSSCRYEIVLPQGMVVRVPVDFYPAQVTGLLRAVVSAC